MKADILAIQIIWCYAPAVQFCKRLVTNHNSDFDLRILLLFLIR